MLYPIDATRARDLDLLDVHGSLIRRGQPVITGCENMERLDQALHAADTFRPLTNEQVTQLLAKTKPLADAGKCEPFKITSLYDGTAQNPEWMGEAPQAAELGPAGSKVSASASK